MVRIHFYAVYLLNVRVFQSFYYPAGTDVGIYHIQCMFVFTKAFVKTMFCIYLDTYKSNIFMYKYICKLLINVKKCHT